MGEVKKGRFLQLFQGCILCNIEQVALYKLKKKQKQKQTNER